MLERDSDRIGLVTCDEPCQVNVALLAVGHQKQTALVTTLTFEPD